MNSYNRSHPHSKEDYMALDDVLEPYHPQANSLINYDNDAEVDELLQAELDAIESEAKFRTAMSVVDIFSILLGILIIFLLVTMLLMMGNWLKSDILQSVFLLQSDLS